MSAFVVSHNHITVLVAAAIHYGVGVPGQAERVACDPDGAGQRLHEVNVASVNARYANHEPEQPEPYAFRCSPALDRMARTPVQVIKAAHCFDYQACELPDWDERPEKRFCDDLIRAATYDLPGYEAADWDID